MSGLDDEVRKRHIRELLRDLVSDAIDTTSAGYSFDIDREVAVYLDAIVDLFKELS